MSVQPFDDSPGSPAPAGPYTPLDATVVHSAPAERVPSRRVNLPIFLFVATCVSTTLAHGPVYGAAIMFILLCHEMGHYIQARRYHVPASLPYFIPMPISPLGTMGAVIGMRGNMGDRKALFDIGISGPLAGLVPVLIFTVIGLQLSSVENIPKDPELTLGDPLLFQFLTRWFFGPMPPGKDVFLHPLAYAGWVGVLITSLNLFPIGQLDGGHILYAILRRKAHLVASALLVACIAAVILTNRFGWMLMLVLLLFIGPKHPPTANDDAPLGTGRIILGWLTLAFIIIGFTPDPFF